MNAIILNYLKVINYYIVGQKSSFAYVAQLVERTAFNRVVVGSNPTISNFSLYFINPS